MNRRDFFKALATAGVVLAIPALPGIDAPLAPKEGEQSPPYDGFTVRRHPVYVHNYDMHVGMAVSVNKGDERWRQAVVLPRSVWNEFTDEQREETWQFVERMTYNIATRRPVLDGLIFKISEAA